MSGKPRFLFACIIILTLIAAIINIPAKIPLSLDTTIPLINKKISIHKTFNGINPNAYLGPLKMKRDLSFKKGLDLEGGTSITLKANMQGVPQDKQKDALDSAKSVIERRVNFFGVSEPIVQTAKVNNDYRIIVEIPGITNVSEAVSLIGTTAKLTFWEQGASGSGKLTPQGQLPLGIEQLYGQNGKKTNLSGEDLQQATVTFNSNTAQPQVQLTFTPEGSKKFAEITQRNVGKILAIALDNYVIEPPRVNEPILNGSAVITGNFTTEQAKALSVQLNAGALPISLAVLEQHTIGASLGQNSLTKSLFAGILGFLVIVIFMCVLYGRLGIIASIALVVYTLLTLSLFRLIPITLTLAGIAGFILSIGIAVDANILIFERMREELRKGKSSDAALALGFSRAWSSIRDSNIASLITCTILYYFGTGIIRGFAITLALGVLVSLFSAITVTRTLLRMFYKS